MVPIDTLEQLETSELQWFVGKQNYFYDHFDDKEDMIERRVTLPEGKDVFKIIEYSLQKMLESPNTYALIYRLNAVELAIAITYADDEGFISVLIHFWVFQASSSCKSLQFISMSYL